MNFDKRIFFNFLYKVRRNFSTSEECCGKSNPMRKLMGGSKKRKHIYIDTPVIEGPKTTATGLAASKKPVNSRRMAVLNKLFMRHITDLMTTGESNHLFLGHGIEINRIKVTPDFKALQIFWLAKGTPNDNVIEELLEKQAIQLRHELSNLKVIGVVPKLQFIKDKHLAQLMEVDLRLGKADFGEDYVPTEAASKLKSELRLLIPLEPNIKQKILELESVHQEENDDDIPPMPQNVLGLDHANIMDKIQKAMKKSSSTHCLHDEVKSIPACQGVNENPVSFGDAGSHKKAFKEFLAKREILKLKANKARKNENIASDYLEEEWEIKRRHKFNEFEWENDEENDYCEEDDDRMK